MPADASNDHATSNVSTYSRPSDLKITDMQAAVGLSQLQKVEGFIQKRRENFNYFTQALKGLDEFIRITYILFYLSRKCIFYITALIESIII